MKYLRMKTTWAGIATLVSGIGYAIATGDFTAVVPAITGGLGLVFSSDV